MSEANVWHMTKNQVCEYATGLRSENAKLKDANAAQVQELKDDAELIISLKSEGQRLRDTGAKLINALKYLADSNDDYFGLDGQKLCTCGGKSWGDGPLMSALRNAREALAQAKGGGGDE